MPNKILIYISTVYHTYTNKCRNKDAYKYYSNHIIIETNCLYKLY